MLDEQIAQGLQWFERRLQENAVHAHTPEPGPSLIAVLRTLSLLGLEKERGHYKRGLFVGGISRISKVSKSILFVFSKQRKSAIKSK